VTWVLALLVAILECLRVGPVPMCGVDPMAAGAVSDLHDGVTMITPTLLDPGTGARAAPRARVASSRLPGPLAC
jgi:hypothetical protein